MIPKDLSLQAATQILLHFIKPRSTLILGISGGPDSIALLHQCLELAQRFKVKLVVAHVNHGIRGRASNHDALFVEKTAKKYGLAFEPLTLRLTRNKGNGNLEAQGRTFRYIFFEKLRKKYRAQWILTAHHQNDNIETALFNLIRGASFQGIKGMALAAPTRHLLRPFLTTTKATILDYLKKNRLSFCTDTTNQDIRFSRNLLRQCIIPLFAKINTNFETTFQSNLENFHEIAKFLEQKTKNWLRRNVKDDRFSLQQFLHQPLFLQKNILAALYQKTYGSTQKLTLQQLNEILKVLNLQKANRQKEFGPAFFMAVIHDAPQSPRMVKIIPKKPK